MNLSRQVGGLYKGRLAVGYDNFSAFLPRVHNSSASGDDIPWRNISESHGWGGQLLDYSGGRSCDRNQGKMKLLELPEVPAYDARDSSRAYVTPVTPDQVQGF